MAIAGHMAGALANDVCHTGIKRSEMLKVWSTRDSRYAGRAELTMLPQLLVEDFKDRAGAPEQTIGCFQSFRHAIAIEPARVDSFDRSQQLIVVCHHPSARIIRGLVAQFKKRSAVAFLPANWNLSKKNSNF